MKILEAIGMSLKQVSAFLAIFTCVLFVSYRTWKKKKIILNDLIVSIIAGGMLPLGIAFALYTFCPDLIGSLENRSLQITITGIILIYVYVQTIIEKLNADVP